jgi:hypothetical protein
LRNTFIIALFGLLCCAEKQKEAKDCEVDSEFRARFQNCLNLASLREAGVYTNEDVYGAYRSLELITGNPGFVESDSDTPLSYPYIDSINYFCKDVEMWLGWFRGNKCMKLSTADSLLKANGTTWPKYLDEIDLTDLGCEKIFVK